MFRTNPPRTIQTFSLALAICGIILTSPTTAIAAQEQITRFQSEITLDASNRATIQETIVYDFGFPDQDEDRHGIFRTVPVEYTVQDGSTRVHPAVVQSITDETGKAYPYSTSTENGNIVWKIGDPDETVTGRRIYVIRYLFEAPILSGTNVANDKIFSWNVTGNGWNVPIQHASVSVNLQDISVPPKVRSCFTGQSGATSAACSSGYTDVTKRFEAETIKPLQSYEGLTIDLNFGKADIAEPALTQFSVQPRSTVFVDGVSIGEHENAVFALSPGEHQVKAAHFTYRSAEQAFTLAPGEQTTVALQLQKPWYWWTVQVLAPILLAFAYLWWLLQMWLRHGREPRASKVIVTEFEVPKNLMPLEVGAMMDQRVSTNEIASHIVYLATQGYLTIRRDNDAGVLQRMGAGKHRYTFIKQKELPSNANPVDRKIFEAIFQAGENAESEVSTDDLKKRFHKEVDGIHSTVFDVLVSKKFLASSPRKQRTIYSVTAIVVGAVGVAGFVFLDTAMAWGALVAAAILGLGIAQTMGKRTPEGAQVYRALQGYKKYLTVAEKARIEFHNDPKKYQQLFESVLPFAMVLGVEKEWVKHFQDLQYTPTWYTGHGAFIAASFASDMNSFSSAVQASTQSPSSGAGGSSGGGFGGGGGGSW
jgi:hypothetical protein